MGGSRGRKQHLKVTPGWRMHRWASTKQTEQPGQRVVAGGKCEAAAAPAATATATAALAVRPNRGVQQAVLPHPRFSAHLGPLMIQSYRHTNSNHVC